MLASVLDELVVVNTAKKMAKLISLIAGYISMQSAKRITVTILIFHHKIKIVVTIDCDVTITE